VVNFGSDPAGGFKALREILPKGPLMCGEFYPGWFDTWGAPHHTGKTPQYLADLEFMLTNGASFSIYMAHGGTTFGLWSGADRPFKPDTSSYDYDAPLDEMGRPTPKYFAIRDLIKSFLPKGTVLPDLPAPLPAVEVPAVTFTETTGLFDNLPEAVRSPQPRPMETFGQNHGFILYRTRLVGHHSGKLAMTEVRDYASVYVDGAYLGALSRTRKESTLDIPKADPPPKSLDILVEAMGRINFGPLLLDRKGITERVTLDNMTLMGWEVFPLPMADDDLAGLKFGTAPATRPGNFFRGRFDLPEVGDTYLDMTGWKKGIVWVNGHNLGRYWEIGPQRRLYCPAPFLKQGMNEIVVFDLHALQPAAVRGWKSLE